MNPSPTRNRLIGRWLLAGPLAIVTAIVVMAAAPLFLPVGRAGIDNLVFPILLFPAFWAVAFFYAVLESNLIRATIVLGSICAICAVIVAFQFQ